MTSHSETPREGAALAMRARCTMNVRQAAERLEVSPALVYQLVREGRLGHLRIGASGSRGKIVISQDDVERFRESVRLTPRDEPASPPLKLRHLNV